MTIRRLVALCGALAALGLITAGAALAAGTGVSVRVEGLKRTLVPATVVRPGNGSITKGGAPPGSCPAASAAGALDAATHHNWNGTYDSGLGIEVTSILGETHVYSAKGYYWGIWVNGRESNFGVCDLKLHAGEQILFAPAPGSGNVYPLLVSAPKHATVGHAFTLRVTAYGAKGGAKPVSGVSVTGARRTNRAGVTHVTEKRSGKITITVSRKGYVRDEALVDVAA